MDALCLQDWITITGAFEVTAVTQGSRDWLDLHGYEDLVFYLDVKAADAGTKVNYQTAPVPEELSFVTMTSTPSGVSTGVRTDAALAVYSPVPLARYLRWRLTNPASQAWGITFRIWVAAYSLP